MTRCIEASSPPAGLTVHLVEGHAVDLHIAGVTAGTLHWADGRRVEVAPSLPGTASGDGLSWSLDGDLTAQLRAAGVAYVQLVADDRVLMAGDVAWYSGWSGSCQPYQRAVYVTGPPGEPGVGIDTITAVDGTATITLTDGSIRPIDLPPGHTPGVGLDGDQLTVDGVPVGDSLRGPSGHTPEVIVDGDVITIDGQATDPLTGPPVATRWEGTALVVDDQPPVDLKGTKGDPGPVSSLTIGTVTTGTAAASITGTAPDQALNLVLPPGTPGAPGAPGAVATSSTYLIVSPGRPDTPSTTGGTITGSEPVGAEYRSTDGAGVGAWVWMKRPSGWVVTDGDTGWRDLASTMTVTSGKVILRRIGFEVIYRFVDAVIPSGFLAETTGFVYPRYGSTRPYPEIILVTQAFNVSSSIWIGQVNRYSGNRIQWAGNTNPVGGDWRFHTNDPWPTTLPGTPS